MSHVSMQDRSLGDLVAHLGRDIVALVRDEIHLARAEVDESVQKMLSALVSIGVGLAVAVAAMVILLQAAVVGLSSIWEPWVASLVVGAAAALLAFILAKAGQSKLKSTSLAPRRSRDSLKRDRDTIKEHAR